MARHVMLQAMLMFVCLCFRRFDANFPSYLFQLLSAMGHSKQGNQSSHRHPRPSRLSYSDSASTAKAQHSKKKSMLLRTPANNPPSKAAWNKMVKLDSLKGECIPTPFCPTNSTLMEFQVVADLNTAEGQHKFYPEDRCLSSHHVMPSLIES